MTGPRHITDVTTATLNEGTTMSQLVNPHGKEKKLKPLLLAGKQLAEAQKQAAKLKKITITSRETGDAS